MRTHDLVILAHTAHPLLLALLATCNSLGWTDPSEFLVANSTFQFGSAHGSALRLLRRADVLVLFANAVQHEFHTIFSTRRKSRLADELLLLLVANSLFLLVLTNAAAVDFIFSARNIASLWIALGSNRRWLALVLAHQVVVNTLEDLIGTNGSLRLQQTLFVADSHSLFTSHALLGALGVCLLLLALEITHFMPFLFAHELVSFADRAFWLQLALVSTFVVAIWAFHYIINTQGTGHGFLALASAIHGSLGALPLAFLASGACWPSLATVATGFLAIGTKKHALNAC